MALARLAVLLTSWRSCAVGGKGEEREEKGGGRLYWLSMTSTTADPSTVSHLTDREGKGKREREKKGVFRRSTSLFADGRVLMQIPDHALDTRVFGRRKGQKRGRAILRILRCKPFAGGDIGPAVNKGRKKVEKGGGEKKKGRTSSELIFLLNNNWHHLFLAISTVWISGEEREGKGRTEVRRR